MQTAANTSLDLSAFDVTTGANEGFTVELLDKSGKKSGHTIRVLGKDSTDFTRTKAAQDRRRLARLKKGLSTLTTEEIDEDALDLLAAVTKAWSFTLPDGTAYPCTPSNALNLYRQSTLIREQIDMAVNDRENFIKS